MRYGTNQSNGWVSGIKRILIFLLVFWGSVIALNGQIKIKDIAYTEAQYEDLSFLKAEIKDQRIVCLGEEWHRTETFSQIKNRIVKYLYQELDFDVIVFESSVYGPFAIEVNQLAGKQRLFESLQHIWRTQSVFDLINFTDKVQQSPRPIQQYGIDLQGAYSERYSNILIDLFNTLKVEWVPEIVAAERLIQQEWLNKHQSLKKYESSITLAHKAVYEQMIDVVNNKAPLAMDGIDKDYLIWLINNRIALCNYLVGQEGKFYREQVLADNLEWVLNRVGPDKKVIVWAADLHITKKQAQTYRGAEKSMIELLPEELLQQVYSLSLIPIESAPKEVRKTLKQSSGRFFFYSTKEDNPISARREEFDGQIVCKGTESIEQYKIE
ncbi:MAG: erythromycin esterase family protein [Mameliella sp.]|nr:erythromycin esterase family protein [Phaeodactylibacter sp.]